ncbi:MAG: class I SAM-dependent methyltransferase [Lachnospiraceae bacterium]|nr:class I SAM-dependent methyltransferase [Lachnospiraceae bacterium]
MWLADKWKDYEVLDTAAGEKLERWGDYILIRPDPQVIWNTKRKLPEWKRANGIYHRSDKGGGSWTFDGLPEVWSVSYGDLTFRLKPMGFKHTGLFPEQAVNWDAMRALIRGAGRPVRVLNLFAYTGAASIACAKEGASVVHVDSSKGMVTWAKENAAASGLKDAPVRYLVDDCLKFVEREIRRGNTYDGIVMDPPSYGRGPSGEIWKLEDSLYPFLTRVARLLSATPLFVFVNSYTTGLQPLTIANLMSLAFGDEKKGTVQAGEIGLPVRNGLILPCGACGRMTF